jgi:hypothetical protein
MASFFRLFYQQCSRKHDWGVFGPYQKKVVTKKKIFSFRYLERKTFTSEQPCQSKHTEEANFNMA